MPSVNVLWVQKLDYEKDWGIRGNSHDYRQLFYITDGEGIMQINGQEYSLKQNSCVLIRPFEFHRLYRIRKGCLRMIDIKFDVTTEPLAKALDGLPSAFIAGICSLPKVLSEVRDEWKTGYEQKCSYGGEFAGIHLERALYSILRDRVAGSVSVQNPELAVVSQNFTSPVSEIAEYLLANYNADFSLDDLSDRLAYNKNYLCTVFKATTGKTIKNYVMLLRVKKAVELIQNTNRSFTEISEEIGFKSIHHFNRVFKSVLNKTPGDIRNQERAGMDNDILGHGKYLYRYYSKSNDTEE